jgi:hypothetical protein
VDNLHGWLHSNWDEAAAKAEAALSRERAKALGATN